jgi:hypothetical protein
MWLSITQSTLSIMRSLSIRLQFSEDMIVKDHVSRRIFRELKDLPRVVMDEFQLSPMKYAHLMLPAITFRSLNAPTVRPSTYHTLFEAYVKRFYPDHWLEILRAVLSQHMTPAIFMRLAQTDGGFARWLRDESGVADYQFNPPRINNLTELQETIDLAREEALDSMSRSSLPNLDYYPQDNSPSRLVGHTQGSPLVFEMLHSRTARTTGIPTNGLPTNQTAPASLLALILQEKSSTLTVQSVGYSMRQIEEEFLAPQTALIAVEGLEPSTDPFSHQRGNYANLETLNQGCLSFGPVVLDNHSLLLEEINSLFLVEDLPFHRIPNSPPMDLADSATHQSLQRLQTQDFWAVLTKKVVIPFLDLYCPSARYPVLRNMIFHSHHDALQVFSVPSQFVRRLRNMGLKLVTANPQREDPVLRLPKDGDTQSITVLETTVHPGVKLKSFFESMSQWINSLSPQQEGTVSEYYTVAPNLTEMMVTDEMIGPGSCILSIPCILGY